MRKTILLIEDNADDRALAEVAFGKLGLPHLLSAAEDGETALERVFLPESPSAGPPDLILLDLKLRGMDGLEVLRRLRADPRGARIPVVVLTSSVEERDLRQTYDLGANSYIRKPTDFDEFIQVLDALLHYWLDLNQPWRSR